MDQELYGIIGRAKCGDNDAFGLLVKRYKDYVFRYAFVMLSDRINQNFPRNIMNEDRFHRSSSKKASYRNG